MGAGICSWYLRLENISSDAESFNSWTTNVYLSPDHISMFWNKFLMFALQELKRLLFDRLFEGLAIKTLNNCYKEDQAKTFQLLSRIQETEYWNNVTCLEIAELARCKKFIAQEPCQNFADRIWRGLDPYSKNEEDKVSFELYYYISLFSYEF